MREMMQLGLGSSHCYSTAGRPSSAQIIISANSFVRKSIRDTQKKTIFDQHFFKKKKRAGKILEFLFHFLVYFTRFPNSVRKVFECFLERFQKKKLLEKYLIFSACPRMLFRSFDTDSAQKFAFAKSKLSLVDPPSL